MIPAFKGWAKVMSPLRGTSERACYGVTGFGLAC